MTITRGDVEAWYPLQRDPRDIITTNDGNLQDSPTLQTDSPFDKLIGSYNFDGQDDYIESDSAVDLDITNPHSFSLWFKVSSLSPINCLIAYGRNTGTNGTRFACLLRDLTGDGDRDDLFVANAGGNTTWADTGVVDGNWHHLVVTSKGTDLSDVNAYIDGNTLTRTELNNQSFNSNSSKITIGATNEGSPAHFAEGLIGQTAVFQKELSSSERSTLYNGGDGVTARGQFPLTDSLEAYYKLDGNADDATGNGNDGTVNGATVTSPGRIGDAYVIDASGEEITATTTATESYTVSCWVNSNGKSDFQAAVNRGDYNNNTRNIWLGIDDSSNSGYFSIQDSNGTEYTVSAGNVPDNQWVHLVGVCTGSELRLYIDASLAGTTTFNGTVTTADNTTRIGNNPGDLFFDGAVDEVGIYNNIILTDGEVRRLYSYGAGLRYEDLDKEHPLNDGVGAAFTHDSADVSGSTLSDAKNGTYDATIGAGITSGTSGLVNESQEAFGGGQSGTTDEFVETGYTFDEAPSGFSIGTYMNLDQKPNSERYSLAGARGDNGGTRGDLNLAVEDEFLFNGLLWKTRLEPTNYGAIVYDMSNVDTGVWKSVVGTFDDTDGYELFYAGSSVGTNNDTTWGAPTDGSSLSLFAFEQGNGSHQQAFDGRLDGSVVWVRSLSLTEANEFDNDGEGQQFPYSLETGITAVTQAFSYQFTPQTTTALPGATAQPLNYTYTAQPSTISKVTTASPFNYNYYQAVEPVRLFGAAGNIIITGRNT